MDSPAGAGRKAGTHFSALTASTAASYNAFRKPRGLRRGSTGSRWLRDADWGKFVAEEMTVMDEIWATLIDAQ